MDIKGPRGRPPDCLDYDIHRVTTRVNWKIKRQDWFELKKLESHVLNPTCKIWWGHIFPKGSVSAAYNNITMKYCRVKVL